MKFNAKLYWTNVIAQPVKIWFDVALKEFKSSRIIHYGNFILTLNENLIYYRTSI